VIVVTELDQIGYLVSLHKHDWTRDRATPGGRWLARTAVVSYVRR